MAQSESKQVPAQPEWQKSVLRDYFETACIAVIFALFVRTFVVQTFKIPSRSMEDTILVGDHILVDKFGYGEPPPLIGRLLPYRSVEHSDVFVFRFPKEPERDFIKRVIGTPGDTIATDRGFLLRDGERVEEPYAVFKDPRDGQLLDAGDPRIVSTRPRRVGPNEYFAMGDNRLNSEDSRYWGGVPEGHVKGRALFIYWSFDVPPHLEQIDQVSNASAKDRGRLIGYTLLHFFDKTRWKRTFRVIR